MTEAIQKRYADLSNRLEPMATESNVINKKWKYTLTDKLVPFLNHMRIHTYICHSVGKWDITLTEKS